MEAPSRALDNDLDFQAFALVSGSAFLWPQVCQVVKQRCGAEGYDDRATKLCLALAKYDSAQTPYNWLPLVIEGIVYQCGETEEMILAWAEYLLGDPEMKEAVEEIIATYEKGFIPDCFREFVSFA